MQYNPQETFNRLCEIGGVPDYGELTDTFCVNASSLPSFASPPPSDALATYKERCNDEI